MFKIKINNITIFIFLILYKLLLDLSYIVFIHKNYEYMGFILDLNLYKYVFSLFIFVVIYYMLPKDNDKPSSIFLQLHFIIMIIPMFTIYALMNESNVFFILSMIIFSVQYIILKLIPNIKIVRIKESKYILYILLIGITFFVYFSMIKANGISLRALNILNVYDIRDGVSYPFLMTYLVTWQAKVINPFLIAISYMNKNKKLLFTSIILQLILYLITAHKSYLLITIAILIVMKILFSKRDFLKVISQKAALLTTGLIGFYVILTSLTMPSLFLRRLLFIPAQIKFHYYDFFSKNEFLYFSQGTIGGILQLKYPYDMNSANMIGSIYFNNPQISSNTGYIADAYANMGFLGMLLIALIFVFILVLIDSLSIKLGKGLTVGLTLFPIMALNDSALQTTLLTGGLLFLLIVLYLYSSSHEEFLGGT